MAPLCPLVMDLVSIRLYRFVKAVEIMPTGPPECTDPVWTLPTLVVLTMVCIGLLVTTLALGVVGPSRMVFVLHPLMTLRGTAAFPRVIPRTPPPVVVLFPWTVLGILLDPLTLQLTAFPLLFIMIRVVNPTTWLFPIAPEMWPTEIIPATTLLLLWPSTVTTRPSSLP